ncbi:MAG: hypothetical protein NUV42_01205 [Candidatus Yonathbacteria bacterium]|nr:hypothetical protein [Candidatus Yonathbacteria bacterium]MCR4330434.1 hypothetical protein [Patescibacteria group bacterium]
MDPYTRKLLEDILGLTQENNKLLKKMHRASIWRHVFSALYWIVIVGAMLGSYYYLQPYIDVLIEAYDTLISSVESVQNLGSTLPKF